MDFITEIKQELRAMINVEIISRKKAIKAAEYVDLNPELFNEQSAMSVSEAVDLAIACI